MKKKKDLVRRLFHLFHLNSFYFYLLFGSENILFNS